MKMFDAHIRLATRAAWLLVVASSGCTDVHTLPEDAGPATDAVVVMRDANNPDVCFTRPERCDGADDDCDGIVDDGADFACAEIDAARPICEGGRCVPGMCDAGWLDCNGLPADPCETHAAIDRANCGACGHRCAMREACTDGVCVEDPIVDLAPAALDNSCMVLQSGRLLCWGRNSGGAFATEPMGTLFTSPRDVEGVPAIAEVEVSYWTTCVRSQLGDVLCAGWGEAGRGADPGGAGFHRVELPRPAVALFGAWSQTCALLDDSVLWCWGEEYSAPDSGGRPWRVDLPGAATTVYGAGNGVCALVAGQPWCWGWDVDGLFAAAPPTYTAIPVPGMALAPMSVVRCGFSHCCGIDENGDAECWGRNDEGQLGRGDAGPTVSTPAIVDTPFSPLQVEAGWASCAISTEGSLFCWGSGRNGWNGLGGLDANRPTLVPLPSAAIGLHANINVACVTLGLTSIRCWGQNESGQLGDGTLETRLVPTPVTGFE